MRTRTLAAAAVLTGLSVAAYRRWVTPWHESWGATAEENALPLPGDHFVEEPAAQITRGITIDADPEDVWPWLVQMGADRGGFYTYDSLENLIGLDIHSADDIVPEWQDLAAGDVVYASGDRSAGWYVVDLRPNEALVLQVGDLAAGRPVRRDEKLRWEFLWTFALQPGSDGTTRLLVRERTAFESVVMRALMAPVGPVSFVMTRGMLLGIKSRVEGRRRPSPSPSTGPKGRS